MYLLIYEDGSLQTATTLADDVFAAADDGYVDVIDVSGDAPLQYHQDEWHKINSIDT